MTNFEVYQKMQIYMKKIAYGTSGNALNRQEYIGWAPPGTATSAAGWLIQKLVYNSSGMVTDIQWAASENDKFNKVWDNRATAYTYG